MRRSRFLLWLAAVVVLPAISACVDDSLAGTYTARTFTFSQTGTPTRNALTSGGSINLVIANDLTTSGTMVIPASVTGSGDQTFSLLGSATRQGDIVTLQLISSSFLRDMQFAYDGTALSGMGTYGDYAVAVTLTK